MDLFTYIREKNHPLHHFYIIEGDLETSKRDLEESLTLRGVRTVGNPDYTSEMYSSFLVTDAEGLRIRAREGAIANSARIFFIGLRTIGREAENSLLKLFEEPIMGTTFFLAVTHLESLLPTTRSRAEIYRTRSRVATTTLEEVEQFVRGEKAARLEFIKKFIELYEGEANSGLLRSKTRALLNGLEEYFYKKKGIRNTRLYENIMRSKQFLEEPGASVKMILEGIALSF